MRCGTMRDYYVMESGILGEAPVLAIADIMADTIEEFKQAADLRLSSARKLEEAAKDDNDSKHLSDACYLGGYVVEMLLKAAVVKDKDKERLSELTELKPARCSCRHQGELVCSVCHTTPTRPRNKYKTHDIALLMKALGNSTRFSAIVARHQEHLTSWNSEVRYTYGPWIPDPQDARTFLKHVGQFAEEMRNGGLGANA